MCILIGSVPVFQGLGGIYLRLRLSLEMGLILFEEHVGFLVFIGVLSFVRLRIGLFNFLLFIRIVS
jgi:hypothetical protein